MERSYKKFYVYQVERTRGFSLFKHIADCIKAAMHFPSCRQIRSLFCVFEKLINYYVYQCLFPLATVKALFG